jgi:ribosomal-protein-alanine N-acetyltransferase
VKGSPAPTRAEFAPVVRRFMASDAAAVAALSARSPGAAQWSGQDYERIPAAGYEAWVAERSGKGVGPSSNTLVGFLIARGLAGEMEILNVAVEPVWRRRSVASLLLKTALSQGRASGARRAFLEVRESNAAALAFYQQHGFTPVGRRPRYYSDPPEDGLVLSLQLTEISL